MSMEMELGGVLFTDPITKYSYRSVFENFLNYIKLIADTRLLAEGWKKDKETQSEVTNPTGDNTAQPATTRITKITTSGSFP